MHHRRLSERTEGILKQTSGKSEGRLLLIIVVAALLLTVLTPVVRAQNQNAPLATLLVTKSIQSVSTDDVATFRLSIQNNGTVPVFDVEVYEYMNTALQSVGDIRVSTPEGQNTVGLATGSFGTPSQVIVDPPPPASLMPGQSLTLEYKMRAPHSGDFQVPASLAWFSYLRDRSTIRSNYYSNGLLLHIAGGFEKVIIKVYPYVLSVTTFAATLTVLFWARGKLQKK